MGEGRLSNLGVGKKHEHKQPERVRWSSAVAYLCDFSFRRTCLEYVDRLMLCDSSLVASCPYDESLIDKYH